MNLSIFDPLPMGNEYCTRMFLAPIRKYAAANNVPCSDLVVLTDVKNSTVVLLTDHLSEERILMLKNNGNRIVGINVTDSSYISGAIRYAESLPLVDLIFMVSGVPNTNAGSEIAVDENFNVTLVDKPFLDERNWTLFDIMRRAGRLQSLPYVPWTAPPDVPHTPWPQRSQKVLLRGGGHARRFLLALFLQAIDKLDPNSGFNLRDYFDDKMNPQFRYCDDCRAGFKQLGRSQFIPGAQPNPGCTSPVANHTTHGWDMADLGQWNNKCPKSFFWMAEQFSKKTGRHVDMSVIEGVLNSRFLPPKEHMERLARITFTSDFKWVHSIYAPQRFWEAACAGCINVLPERVMNQDYFPKMTAGVHYMVFEETMQHLELAFTTDSSGYNNIASEALRLYEQWLSPSVFGINANLLTHMFEEMRKL